MMRRAKHRMLSFRHSYFFFIPKKSRFSTLMEVSSLTYLMYITIFLTQIIYILD